MKVADSNLPSVEKTLIFVIQGAHSTLPKVAVSFFVGQFCGYINFSASYESLCVKSPPSASCKTLAVIVKTTYKTRNRHKELKPKYKSCQKVN